MLSPQQCRAAQALYASSQGRLPTKLAIEWRQGIDATKYKTIPVPARVCARLRPLLLEDDVGAAAAVATGPLATTRHGGDLGPSSVAKPEASEDGLLQAPATVEEVPGDRSAAESGEIAARSVGGMHASAIEAIVTAVGTQVWHGGFSIFETTVCLTGPYACVVWLVADCCHP